MRPSEPQAKIPKSLKGPLGPLKRAEDSSDFWKTYFYNMQQCGICYKRYEALVEAVNEREKD